MNFSIDLRRKVLHCIAKLSCDKPALAANRFRLKRMCVFWCTSMSSVCNNAQSLHCDVACENTKVKAIDRFPLLSRPRHGKREEGHNREAKRQKPRSQARYLKFDVPHLNGMYPRDIDGTAPFLQPIVPNGNRSHQNLSMRIRRFSFPAHTTSAWNPLF